MAGVIHSLRYIFNPTFIANIKRKGLKYEAGNLLACFLLFFQALIRCSDNYKDSFYNAALIDYCQSFDAAKSLCIFTEFFLFP
jgi:hypothetical protein